MPAQPPRPPREPGSGEGGAADRSRRRASAAWRRRSVQAWARLRALPTWMQLLLWMTAWPVVAALYVAGRRRLGPLAAPLTVALLLLGGLVWWSVLTGDAVPTGTDGEGTERWTAPRTNRFATMALADVTVAAGGLPEFDRDTLGIEIVECVQTRSRSTVREGTIRQPRLVVRVTNHGPARSVVLQGAVLLDGYSWNGGWKPTAATGLELGRGETVEATLLTDYRHQSNYSRDGLHACRLIDLQVVAPHVWPDNPARQVLPVDAAHVAGSERDFDPQRDLLRTDTR